MSDSLDAAIASADAARGHLQDVLLRMAKQGRPTVQEQALRNASYTLGDALRILNKVKSRGVL